MSEAPQLEPTNDISDFERVATRMAKKLEASRVVDYETVYAELPKLTVRLEEDPSLQQLSLEMQKVQAAKDRVAELLKHAVRNALLHKRVGEVLLKGWNRFSNEKSSDKREGEAMIKLSQFIEAEIEAESFYRTISGVMKNLDSQHEAVSRQISCLSLTLKLRDQRWYADPESSGRKRESRQDGDLESWSKPDDKSGMDLAAEGPDEPI